MWLRLWFLAILNKNKKEINNKTIDQNPKFSNFVDEVWKAMANTLGGVWHINTVWLVKKEVDLNDLQKYNLLNIKNSLSAKKYTSDKQINILLPILSMHKADIDKYLIKFLEDNIKKWKLWSDKIYNQFVKYINQNLSDYNTYWWDASVIPHSMINNNQNNL